MRKLSSLLLGLHETPPYSNARWCTWVVVGVGSLPMAAVDVCSWLLFLAVLVNQAGRVMIPAVKTSVLADPAFGNGS